MSCTSEIHGKKDSGEENDLFCKKESLGNEPFDSFEFQNQLTAVVEELRLKRKLEEENENTIKSLLDEKYMMERKLDEQQRMHQNEKVLLEEMISQLKKTIEDSFCMSNHEKEKQQTIIQSFQQEIRALKDEARVQYAERLNQEKKVQELEGKLKLCNSFQESTIHQVSDIRQNTKSLVQYCQDLFKMQEELKKNVSHANSMFAEFQIYTDHLLQTVSIMKKKNSTLKQQVISLRTQLQLQKEPAGVSEAVELLKNSEPLKGLHDVLSVEEMLLQSQQQNLEILRNLAESSSLVNQYVVRVEELEKEKDEALVQLEACKKEMQSLKDNLEIRTKNLKQTEREYAKAIRKWDEKEAVKERQCDVAVQTEVADSIHSDVTRCEKSTNVTGEGIGEKCIEHVSIQTDDQGNVFSSVDKSQDDACFETSVRSLHVVTPDSHATGGKCSSQVHCSCSNGNESKLDKKYLSETEEQLAACYENNYSDNDRPQVSQLANPMMSSDHLEGSIDNELNMPGQDDGITVPHDSKEYADENAKVTVSNRKKISGEKEVLQLTEKCGNKCVDNMENVFGSYAIIGTPKTVKRQYEEACVTSAVDGKKRMCERSKFLHCSDNIGYFRSPEKLSDCIEHTLNLGSSDAVESYGETTHYFKKHAWPHEAKDFYLGSSWRDSEPLLTAHKHPATTCSVTRKEEDLNSEVVQLNKATKLSENTGENISSLKNVIDWSCFSDVLGETKMVKDLGDVGTDTSYSDVKVSSNYEINEETSLRDVVLSWDLEISEGTSLQGEKLSCEGKVFLHNDAVERDCMFGKQADQMGNTPNVNSTITEQLQIVGINEKNGDGRLYTKKQMLTSGETGNCSEKDQDCVFRSSALTSPTGAGVCLETVKRDAPSGRFLQTFDTDKGEFCEKLDGLKNVLNVTNTVVTPAEQNSTKRQLESDDAETTVCSKRHNSGKEHDTNIECALYFKKCSDSAESMLYVSTSPAVTTQQTFVSSKEQLLNESNVSASHDEKDNTSVKFSVIPVTFLPSEELWNTVSKNEVTPLSSSQKNNENYGKYFDCVEHNLNVSSCHEILDEPMEGIKNSDDKIGAEGAVHYKNCDSGDSKTFMQIDSSNNHSNCTRKVSDMDSTNERSPQTAGSKRKTGFCCKKQSLDKTMTPPLLGKSKAFGCKFKPPILKNPGARGMVCETDKGIHCEKRSIFSENKASQISDTKLLGNNSETYASNVKNVLSISGNFASEQKMIGQDTGIAACGKSISGNKVLCDENHTLTESKTSQFSHYEYYKSCEANNCDMDSADQNSLATGEKKTIRDHNSADTEAGKKYIFEEKEISQLSNIVQKACFSGECIGNEGNILDVRITPLASSESKVPKRDFVEAERERDASEYPSPTCETGCGYLSEPSVQGSDMHTETNCEKNNNFHENKVPQITSAVQPTENEKTADGMRNVLGIVNFTSALNVSKGERRSLSGHEKQVLCNKCKSCILKDSEHACSLKESSGDVRSQPNMSWSEGTGAKNTLDQTNGNTIGNSKRQTSGKNEAYLLCSNDRSTTCHPESPILKYKNIKGFLSASDNGTLSENQNDSSTIKVSQIREDLDESSGKLNENFENSLNMCKYLETTIRSHVSAAYVGTAVGDEARIPRNEVLWDETVMGSSSFTEEPMDCLTSMRNVSVSSAATVETKVIERCSVETKCKTVFCGKKQALGEAQVPHSNNRSSYCPVKAPLLKFSAMTGILAGVGNESCKQSYVTNKSEVPKFVVAENSDGNGKTALNTSTCSAAVIQQKPLKKFGKAISETLPRSGILGESKHEDAVRSISSPEKHIDCAASVKSDIVEKNKETLSMGAETSGKAEANCSQKENKAEVNCSGKEMNFLKTPIVRYLPALNIFSAAHKENTPPREVISNNSSVPHFSDTSHHT